MNSWTLTTSCETHNNTSGSNKIYHFSAKYKNYFKIYEIFDVLFVSCNTCKCAKYKKNIMALTNRF